MTRQTKNDRQDWMEKIVRALEQLKGDVRDRSVEPRQIAPIGERPGRKL
jgi:hypothetical protein